VNPTQRPAVGSYTCRGLVGREGGLGGLAVNGFSGFRGRLSPNGPPSPRLAPGGFYERGLARWGCGGRVGWDRVVGGGGGGFDVAAGVGAGIDEPGCFELPPDVEIPGGPLALGVGAEGAAEVGALGPGEAEPAEVFEGGGGVFGPAAGAVEVLDPHHEPGGAGPFGGDGEGAGVAHVEKAGRRGGEASATGCGHDGAREGSWLRGAGMAQGTAVSPGGTLGMVGALSWGRACSLPGVGWGIRRWFFEPARIAQVANLGPLFGGASSKGVGWL